MTDRRWDVVTALVLIAAGGWLLALLAEPPRVPVSDPLGPYGLPRVLAIGLVVVGASLLWRRPVRPRSEAEEHPTGGGDQAEAGPGPAAGGADKGRLPGWAVSGLTIVATAGYMIGFSRLGFVVATVLLGLVLLPLLGARHWLTVVVVPAVATAVLGLIFDVALNVGMPGWWGQY